MPAPCAEVNSRFLQIGALRPRCGRRHAEAPAEATMEVGEVVEPRRQGNLADLLARQMRASEQADRVLEAQLHDALGKTNAGRSQEVLDVPLRQVQPCRNCRNREGRVGVAFGDSLHDCVEARRPEAPPAGDFGSLLLGAEHQREQIEEGLRHMCI